MEFPEWVRASFKCLFSGKMRMDDSAVEDCEDNHNEYSDVCNMENPECSNVCNVGKPRCSDAYNVEKPECSNIRDEETSEFPDACDVELCEFSNICDLDMLESSNVCDVKLPEHSGATKAEMPSNRSPPHSDASYGETSRRVHPCPVDMSNMRIVAKHPRRASKSRGAHGNMNWQEKILTMTPRQQRYLENELEHVVFRLFSAIGDIMETKEDNIVTMEVVDEAFKREYPPDQFPEL